MSERTIVRLGLVLGAAILIASVGTFVYLRRGIPRPGPGAGATLPQPGTETYRQMVSAFYGGVAALDVDANEQAQARLAKATQLVAEEPAAWAGQGLLKLRLGDFEGAGRDLERARSLAPESGAIEQLLGLLEGRRGRFPEAVAHLRRAVELEPGNLKARYALAREVERLGEPDSESEALRLMGEILERQPDNLVVLLERARLAAKRGDAEALRAAVDRLGRHAPSWPTKARELYQALEQAAKADNVRGAVPRVAFVKNVLLRVPAFQQNLRAVEAPVGMVGEPIAHFLKMEPPSSTPSPPDDQLAFTVEPLAGAEPARWDVVLPVSLTGEGRPALFAANGGELRRFDEAGAPLPFPGGSDNTAPSPHGVVALDLNADYRMDLVLAGAGGVRILRQQPDGTFADVTASAHLEPGDQNANAFGAWAVDVEMDGDLDVVVGLRKGDVLVLRNNGDGTFRVVKPFEGAKDLRDFAWADLDQDGDPDAALLDAAGDLRIYSNERTGKFRLRTAPEKLGTLAALAMADINGDAAMDLLALRTDGTILRISDKDEGRAWNVGELARCPESLARSARLFVADLDNSGSTDLVASGASGYWVALGDGKGGFRAKDPVSGLDVFGIDDLTGDGRLDLAGLSGEGRAARGVGKGAKNYHWQVLRPRAAKAFGDARINSFGVGGEIEVRADVLFQKQTIAGPTVRFGLGDRSGADVARIVWPNGTVQGEFDLKADQALLTEQRLKGSCPFLYAFDGSRMRFVTDFIWRSPLGLRINAQDTAGLMQTEDWVKIRGDQLAPRDGYYDIRVTAELWETHYFDHMALLVVDHPSGTEVFVDERFARKPPPLAVQATGPPQPVSYARDDQGNDVTELVRARDGRYLDTFGRGAYQGVTRDHWVEIELGDDVPRDRPLQLVAYGWIHPTDSSINVAIGQGGKVVPQGLVLEVATPEGGWAVARPDLGFPAGKNKTILIDLDGVFREGAPRRFRLRTNLEVFWDSLAIAAAAPETTLKTQRLAPESADLRLRGYSRMTQADPSSPELPDYETLIGTSQRWRDLVGYYTRFGDVRPLLEKVDDRYVIANAGDELSLRFKAPTPPPEGWVRDFVMIGDGWNKDGDYNTAFSKTVLPLPSHKQANYDTPPGDLEDDPVYRFHPEDWRDYHTRYVSPGVFQGGLRPRVQ